MAKPYTDIVLPIVTVPADPANAAMLEEFQRTSEEPLNQLAVEVFQVPLPPVLLEEFKVGFHQ